jgi:hypothetical protein
MVGFPGQLSSRTVALNAVLHVPAVLSNVSVVLKNKGIRRTNNIVFLLDEKSIQVKMYKQKPSTTEQSNISSSLCIMLETRDFRNSVNGLFAFAF